MEYAEFQRQKYVKKAAWSAADAAEIDEINEKIQHYPLFARGRERLACLG